MKLILARHGQTDWNADKRLQGNIDIPLNTQGLEQAQKLADYFSGTSIDALYTSKLQRAIQTAERIATDLDLQLIKDARLNEFDWGVFKGVPAAERDAHPELGPQWQRVRDDIRAATEHKGEMFNDFERRVQDVFDDIISAHESGETILIVSHGFVKRVLVAHAMNQPYESMANKYWHNASYSILTKSTGSFEPVQLNQTDHL